MNQLKFNFAAGPKVGDKVVFKGKVASNGFLLPPGEKSGGPDKGVVGIIAEYNKDYSRDGTRGYDQPWLVKWKQQSGEGSWWCNESAFKIIS